jgi:hypothetical protein
MLCRNCIEDGCIKDLCFCAGECREEILEHALRQGTEMWISSVFPFPLAAHLI